MAAAELAELSVSLTPGDADGEALCRRQPLAADHHYASGDAERPRAILERLLDQLPAGSERAKVLRRLGEYSPKDLEKSERLLEQAVLEAASDPRLQAEIVMPRVNTAALRHGPAAAVQLARNLARVVEDSGDPVLLAMFLAELSFAELLSTEGLAPGVLERALELEQHVGPLPSPTTPIFDRRSPPDVRRRARVGARNPAPGARRRCSPRLRVRTGARVLQMSKRVGPDGPETEWTGNLLLLPANR